MTERLFVALDLPETVRAALPGPPGAGAADGPWRAVPRADLHVTLAFLGAQPSSAPVVAALPPALPSVGELRTVRLLALPARRPRVLAVELADPSGTAAALQAVVAVALAAFHESEHRRWLAHVTIARLRGRETVDRRAPLPEVVPVTFRPETVTLYRSHLGRGPARYEPVARWVLPAPV